jgi:pimeloyl-ACP methyl ester carboxylesterase
VRASEAIHRDAELPSGRIHFVEQGSGPAIVLLHGFPEFWFSWREQLPILAAQGFRAVAPDLRGYNLSHRPRDLSDYRVAEIANEIASFIAEVAPGERVVLVGHDWGAVVAWVVASRHPELLRQLVILSVPHPSAVRRTARRPAQLARFWYQFAFQIPWLPEKLLGARRYALLVRTMKRLGRSAQPMDETTIEEYRSAWSQPRALWAMLAYYRALYRRRPARGGGSSIVTVPTLLIHGLDDHIFMHGSFAASAEWVPDLRIEAIAGAGHFVQQDRPDIVNRLIVERAG